MNLWCDNCAVLAFSRPDDHRLLLAGPASASASSRSLTVDEKMELITR
jgi:hypothetical protein